MNFEALLPIAADVQGRGASALCRAGFWESALRLFIKASRIIIVTGFYVKKAGAPGTDGPPGAAALGRALVRTGKSVFLVTDSRNYRCLKACSRSIGGPAAASIDSYEKIPADVDLLVFTERPGHAADGCYYDMDGLDITDVTAPLDKAAEEALRRGVPVLAIGAGGSETGMGLLYDALMERLPGCSSFISRVPASVCLPVDVSNLGAYALTAVLSAFYRRWLGLDNGEEEAMLSAMLTSGAVGAAPADLDGTAQKIKIWYYENL